MDCPKCGNEARSVGKNYFCQSCKLHFDYESGVGMDTRMFSGSRLSLGDFEKYLIEDGEPHDWGMRRKAGNRRISQLAEDFLQKLVEANGSSILTTINIFLLNYFGMFDKKVYADDDDVTDTLTQGLVYRFVIEAGMACGMSEQNVWEYIRDIGKMSDIDTTQADCYHWHPSKVPSWSQMKEHLIEEHPDKAEHFFELWKGENNGKQV